MLLRTSMLASLLLLVAALTTSEVAAQVGYYRTYRADPYRELSRTGKYHGYWRDLGYGVNQREVDLYYYPGFAAPYYGGYGYGGAPYGEINTAPGYYHPPASFPYRYRY